MKIFKCVFLFIFCLCIVNNVQAGVSDFASFFDVDLDNDKLPKMEELYAISKKHEVYNKKYDSFYDLLGDFDEEFKTTIASYGMQEKRIKGKNEDLYLEFLNNIPRKYYQYIGPQLFEVPNMSEKILNLPGIKETKNKFPTRIANAVKDIDDIEFISTNLYFLLMPELWGEQDIEVEYPQNVSYTPKLVYNKNFGNVIKKMVKPEVFQPNYKDDGKKTKSDLRTLHPSKDTLLTAADIKAFIGTIDEVDKWVNEQENLEMFSRVSILWILYNKDDPVGKFVPSGLLDLVHPCARLVQKAKILGKDKELEAIVIKNGFNVNEWGYTCDKTIKAYRMANIRTEMVRVIREFQEGVYDFAFKSLSNYMQNSRFATMQAIVQAHKAPMNDVLEYRKNRNEFEKKLKKYGYKFFGYRINRY